MSDPGTKADTQPFSPHNVLETLGNRVNFNSLTETSSSEMRGDGDLNDDWAPEPNVRLRPAAVLIGLVLRDEGAQVLLTQRPNHMARHAGQIAFPGGRVDPGDHDAVAAALREADEEIGLSAEFITVHGTLLPYQTGTGFDIMPVVASIQPGFTLTPDPGEVEEAFEVPLSFLMDPQNHQRHSAVWRGRRRRYFAMPYGERYIWGATAGMLVNLYDTLYGRS